MSSTRERPLRARWRSTALDADSGLSTYARAAAAVYAEHSVDARGELRYPPSALTLADSMACSERRARAARRELVDAGYLALEERGNEAPSTRLVLPTPARRAGATPAPTPARTPAPTPARRAAGTRGTREIEGPTSGGARARARATELEGAEEGADAQRLVAGYVDRLRERGATTIPSRLRGHVARQVGELVREGVPAPAIATALELMVEKRLNPSTLASLIPEAELGQREPGGNTHADAWKDAGVYDRA